MTTIVEMVVMKEVNVFIPAAILSSLHATMGVAYPCQISVMASIIAGIILMKKTASVWKASSSVVTSNALMQVVCVMASLTALIVQMRVVVVALMNATLKCVSMTALMNHCPTTARAMMATSWTVTSIRALTLMSALKHPGCVIRIVSTLMVVTVALAQQASLCPMMATTVLLTMVANLTSSLPTDITSVVWVWR
jgi:hypothetical protein